MTEQQTPDEQLEQLEQPADDEAPSQPVREQTSSSSSSDGKRFAAYDTRYERFVGKPQDTKAKAKAEAKAFGVEGKSLDVREV